jgi:hypothetical protein
MSSTYPGFSSSPFSYHTSTRCINVKADKGTLLTILKSFFLACSPKQYSFETYAVEFSKVYQSDTVRAARKAVFTANLAKIQQHNEQTPAPSWMMGTLLFSFFRL